MKKQFTYELIDPISIAKNGEQSEEIEVVINAPRPRDKNNALVLESYLSKALMNVKGSSDSAGESHEISEDEKVKGFEMLLIANSAPEDISKILIVLKDLFIDGNLENPQATIGGVKFTTPIFDEIGYKDAKALIARYAVHFLFSDLI